MRILKKMFGQEEYEQYSQSNATSYCAIDETQPAPMAIIYRSEMDYISQCILDYQNIETGGQLFGFVTEYGVPVVCYALGPGRNANHQSTFFNQDTHYLQSVYNEINARYQLQYIGEWHSHHQLGLAKPSGHDAQTIVNGIQRHQFRHFLLCIGNCSHGKSMLNAFTFHLNSPWEYKQVPWKICEITSPYRPIIDRELQHMLVHPQAHPNHGVNYLVDGQGNTAQKVVPNYRQDYWLNDKTNNLILKKIIDFLICYSGSTEVVKPFIDENKHVHLRVKRATHEENITFGPHFPQTPPIITMSPETNAIIPPAWTYSDLYGDIFSSFTLYYDEYVKAHLQTNTMSPTFETEYTSPMVENNETAISPVSTRVAPNELREIKSNNTAEDTEKTSNNVNND